MAAPPAFVSSFDGEPSPPARPAIDAAKVLTLLDRALDAQELRWADLRARIARLEQKRA